MMYEKNTGGISFTKKIKEFFIKIDIKSVVKSGATGGKLLGAGSTGFQVKLIQLTSP